MGSHRADPRDPRRRATGRATSTTSTYVGKRVAGRPAAVPDIAPTLAPAPAPAETVALVTPTMPAPSVVSAAAALHHRAPTVELPALRDIALFDPLYDTSATQLRAIQPAGKRRAVKHAGARGSLFKTLPSLPVAVGVATLAVAIGGTLTATGPQLASSATSRVVAANAMTGSFGTAAVSDRAPVISRKGERGAVAGDDLVAEAEKSAQKRTNALGVLAKDQRREAAEIALNRWVLPMDSYRITATYGEYGLWSSYHTGLDFAGPSGTPIRAITNATVTSVGSDGAYGLKTVLTLEDGTELWLCHQSSTAVSVGDKVRSGEVVGAVGSTGHVTGPHLHVEVRPGGGDPVDPYAAFVEHGVRP